MSIQTQPHKPANVVTFAFLLIAFFTGIASAFQLPTLSLFLSQEIQVSPLMVGIFYSINALLGIILSQLAAKFSDKQEDRRKMILFCCVIAALGCLIFALSRQYYILIFFGTFLLGLGAAANPQSFALAREYAESQQKETTMFTTIMRTQLSLAWIVGPPLAFSIALNWGFTYMYLVAGLAFLLCGVAVSSLIPKIQKARPLNTQVIQDSPRTHRKSTFYLFITCLLLWTCNSMYLINMPLYVIHELQLSEKLAGILMGTAAGLEIPVMLLASYLSQYLSKKQLMLTALLAGLLFYLGLIFAHQTWQLVTLQALNGIFIGIIATIGMVYFQDLMPNQAGSATTLFTNSAKMSWVIGGPIAGFIAQLWHYNSVFYIALGLVLTALYFLSKVKDV